MRVCVHGAAQGGQRGHGAWLSVPLWLAMQPLSLPHRALTDLPPQVMAIGRTWQESMQKALRGMETGLDGEPCAAMSYAA